MELTVALPVTTTVALDVRPEGRLLIASWIPHVVVVGVKGPKLQVVGSPQTRLLLTVVLLVMAVVVV